VAAALARLSAVLPVAEKLRACSLEARSLHRRVLRSFLERGAPPTRAEMAASDSLLRELEGTGLVLFDATGGELSGAYPFTTEQREHKIIVSAVELHAMCALDALAVAPMFKLSTQVVSKCRATGDLISLNMTGLTITAGTADTNADLTAGVHVGIAWGAASCGVCCADSLCTEMIFLRDAEVARKWLAVGDQREIFGLSDAVDFAAQFFTPMTAD
ncbi:unnamed protein product, partial [Polarella glacialis]